MTFQITRGTASYYAGNPEFPDFPWLVEKTLRPGETYDSTTVFELTR